jgi:hypothetical protein
VALRELGDTGLRRADGGSARFVAVACAVYVGAALLTTIPAIGDSWSSFLADGAPGYGEAAPGDHLQTGYRLWLAGHQLENGEYPWRDPYSFQPESEPTANPAWWPYGLPYWPLWRALGPVRAWNLFVLLTFVAAGLAACAWLRELGLGRGAALAGGLVFEIAPYRAAQTAGHLLGPISLLLPLSLWAFERGRREGWNRAWLLLSAVALASIPLSGEVHLALGAIVFYAAYALVRTRSLSALAGASLAVTGTIVAVWAIRRYTVEGTIGDGTRPLRDVAPSSADWLDFVVRHERHGLESFVFLGWVTPVLALVGLGALLAWRQWGLGALLGVSAIVPMLLALGTTTPLFRWAREVVPPLRDARFPAELMPIACLSLAALVAYAVQELADSEVALQLTRHSAALVGAVAVVVLLADLHVTIFHASAADPGNEAYAALRKQPENARVLELPVFFPDVRYGSVYLYYTMQAKRERPGGYSATAPPAAEDVARRLLPLNCGDWTTRPRSTLLRLRARVIAFHRGLYTQNTAVADRRWFAWRALVDHGYRPFARGGAVIVLDRATGGPRPTSPVQEPRRDALLYCDNWYPNDGQGRAMAFPHAGLWVYGSNELRLFMNSARRLRVRFTVDGQSSFRQFVMRSLQEVRVPLPRPGWHLVTLDTVLPEVDGRPEGPRILAYTVT